MRTLLFLISSLDYSGTARRLCLLARRLQRAAFHLRVCVLETHEPWVAALREVGVDVDVLGWQRPLDAKPFVALRTILKREQPALVHVFGSTALRAARLCGARRLVASDLLRGGGAARSWPVDRWLLRGVERVVAFGTADALRYQRLGVPASQIETVTPGVELSAATGAGQGWPEGRVLLGVGPIEAHKGFRDAVWAFDILHFLFDDLRLALVGDGSDRPRVEDFARAIEATKLVTFLGKQSQVEPFLQRATVVWVPSRTGGGVCAALEAMAAGRPVVAARVPELEEIISDGTTGFLVPPDDKAALARQTRFLLDDPALAQRVATAGKRQADEQFSGTHMVADLVRIYEQIGG